MEFEPHLELFVLAGNSFQIKTTHIQIREYYYSLANLVAFGDLKTQEKNMRLNSSVYLHYHAR